MQSSYQLQDMAIVKTLKKFRIYFLGKKIRMITVCDTLQRTMFKEELTLKVIHKTIQKMKKLDALSNNVVVMVTCSQEEITA